MMTYLAMDLVFIGIAVLFDTAILKTHVWRRKSTWITFAVILSLTIIFDSLLTSLPVVTYDSAKLLGIKLGNIPLEDFAYSLVVCMMIPMLRDKFNE